MRLKTTSTSLLLKISVGSVVARGMWNFAAQCSAFCGVLGFALSAWNSVSKCYLLGDIADGCCDVLVAQHGQCRKVNHLSYLSGTDDAYTQSVV